MKPAEKWKELESVILSKETQAQKNTGSVCCLTFSSQFLTGKYGYLAGSKCEPKQRTWEGSHETGRKDGLGWRVRQTKQDETPKWKGEIASKRVRTALQRWGKRRCNHQKNISKTARKPFIL